MENGAKRFSLVYQNDFYRLLNATPSLLAYVTSLGFCSLSKHTQLCNKVGLYPVFVSRIFGVIQRTCYLRRVYSVFVSLSLFYFCLSAC